MTEDISDWNKDVYIHKIMDKKEKGCTLKYTEEKEEQLDVIMAYVSSEVLILCVFYFFSRESPSWFVLYFWLTITQMAGLHWFCLHCMFQSSGKSSVLESIVGRDFLPRGSGDKPCLSLINTITLRQLE